MVREETSHRDTTVRTVIKIVIRKTSHSLMRTQHVEEKL